MNLVKYDNFWNDPFAEFDRFLNRAFNAGRFGDNFGPLAHTSNGGSFRADVYDDADNYYVVAELPGIEKGDIDIQLENAVLSIHAKRTETQGDNERSYELRRTVTVGDDVDADKVGAKLENGLLRVTLPKKEARKPKAITVA